MGREQHEGFVEFEDIICVDETPSGLAIWVHVNGKKVCIPKSTIHDDSEVYKAGTNGVLIISEWIATNKGLV